MESDDPVKRWRDTTWTGADRKDFTFDALEEILSNAMFVSMTTKDQSDLNNGWPERNLHKFTGWR